MKILSCDMLLAKGLKSDDALAGRYIDMQDLRSPEYYILSNDEITRSLTFCDAGVGVNFYSG